MFRLRLFQGLFFFGMYENGKPTGPCWRQLIGSNYLYGVVDKEGEFTGNNIAFIYQDLELALVGKFEKGIMVRISVKLSLFMSQKTLSVATFSCFYQATLSVLLHLFSID